MTKKIKSARRPRRPEATPEERSARAKKAAQTRKMAQVPLDVTINGVKLKGYYPVYSGRMDESHLYLNNWKMIQRKLGSLMMRTTVSRFSPGEDQDLQPLSDLDIYGSNRGIPPFQLQKENGKFVFKVSSAGNQYKSVEPLKVTVKKSSQPEEIDFGLMAASLKPTELMAAVQSLLSDDAEISASIEASEKRVNLSRPLYNDSDSRLAVLLASKGQALSDLPLDIQASAQEGLRKIRALTKQHGRPAGELFNCVATVLKVNLEASVPGADTKEAAMLADFVQRTMGASTLKVTGVDMESIPGYIIVNTNVTDSDGASFSPDTLKRLLKSNGANSLNVSRKGLISFHYLAQSGDSVSSSTKMSAGVRGADKVINGILFVKAVERLTKGALKPVEVTEFIAEKGSFDTSSVHVICKIATANGQLYVSDLLQLEKSGGGTWSTAVIINRGGKGGDVEVHFSYLREPNRS